MDDETKPQRAKPLKKSVEAWALEKGFLRPSDRTFAPWHIQMAKTLRRWPEGLELTEDEFDQALKEAASLTLS